MFEFLFGWRKASRCKNLIKRVRCRLKMLRNKRYTILKQLREDAGQLIKTGHGERALKRTEQLFRDESAIVLYDLLDSFCECTLMHWSYIRRHKDLPNDVNAAISSLIFISARCGELPELREIRKLFAERYDQKFVSTALELLPGNLVNREMIAKLSVEHVPDDDKYRLFDEIAREYCQKEKILAIQYTPEFHNQVEEEIPLQQDSCPQETVQNEMETESPVPDVITISVTSSMLQRSSLEHTTELSSKSDKAEGPAKSSSRVADFADGYQSSKERRRGEKAFIANTVEREEGFEDDASSAESLPQQTEETSVYLDDVEELERCVSVKDDEKDRSVFKFRSPNRPPGDEIEKYRLLDSYESMSDRSTSKANKKRPRRRLSASWETYSLLNDINCVLYYEKPQKRRHANTPSHLHQRRKQKRSPPKLSPLETSKSCYVVYNVFKYPGTYQLKKPTRKNKVNEGKTKDYHFPLVSPASSPSESDDVKMHEEETRIKVRPMPPYVRAMTMPQERAKDGGKDFLLRSQSYNSQNPNHVHPKLPEYEDIATKFIALKEMYLQKHDDRVQSFVVDFM